MRRRTLLAIVVSFAFSACAGDAVAADAALATFAHFQDALFLRDAAALHGLVTQESAPVIDAMPWDRVAGQQPLVPIGACDERGCFHVRVRDPNQGDATGIYVVVRENGRFVVDLVATAALHARPAAGAVPSLPDFEPRELTPADHDRIRRQQLATPPTGSAR